MAAGDTLIRSSPPIRRALSWPELRDRGLFGVPGYVVEGWECALKVPRFYLSNLLLMATPLVVLLSAKMEITASKRTLKRGSSRVSNNSSTVNGL